MSTPTVRSGPRSLTMPRRFSLLAAVALLAAVLAACVEPPPASNTDPYKLRPSLEHGAIALTWQDPAGGATEEFEVQMLTPTTPWTTVGTTSSTSFEYTDVVDGTRYMFRVRGLPSMDWSVSSNSSVAWYFDLHLPVVRIDTQDDRPIADRDNYVPGTISVDPNGATDVEPYSGTLGIRGRGNSTWMYNKKPYRLKLDTKSEMFGRPAERDWILLANAADPSQMRTWVAMEASRAGDLIYTPSVRHVEVILNGRYQGVYIFTEHNELGPDRINITEMEDTDNTGVEVTGGYRLEIDGRLEENNEPGFRTGRQVPVVIKDPDPATPQQRSYIRNFIAEFESALFGPDFANPEGGYRDYLHVPSFIDHYLVQELTVNQDAYWSSTFFTKERGEDLLRSGPVWDFDRSMGNRDAVNDLAPEGFYARERGAWTKRLFQDPLLHQQVADRWQQLRGDFLDIADRLQDVAAPLTVPIHNDFRFWFYPREDGVHETDTPEFLYDWLMSRIAWLDSQYGVIGN